MSLAQLDEHVFCATIWPLQLLVLQFPMCIKHARHPKRNGHVHFGFHWIKSHPNQHCTILLQVQPNDHENVFEHFWKRHCKINSGSMQVSAYFPQNWLVHQGFATVKHFVSGGVVPIQTPQRLRLCSFLLPFLACQESPCSCRGWPGVPDFAANHPK